MKFAIISHYDIHDIIDDHVLYSLRCYRPYFDYIIFVSNSSLGYAQRSKILSLADRVITRGNIGYDFLSWRVGFETVPVDCCSELTFINDSVYGPCCNIADFISRGNSLKADLWGASLSRQFRPHVQSFYMTFRAPLIRSGFARKFWSQVDLLPTKSDIIHAYEIGLSRLAEEHGFKIGGVVDLGVPTMSVRRDVLNDNSGLDDSVLEGVRDYIFNDKFPNPTQLFWNESLRNGSPFVKVEVMRDNPLKANRRSIIEKLKVDRWYDYRLILRHLERVMSSKNYERLMSENQQQLRAD